MIKFTFTKLIAQFSSSFHFKVKIIIKNSSNNNNCESIHSFKYEKGKEELILNDVLELPFESENIKNDTPIQFLLEIYTKTGYKPAGLGTIQLNKINNHQNNIINILKCPLGQGNFHVNIDLPNNNNNNKFNVNDSKKKESNNIINNNNNIKKISNKSTFSTKSNTNEYDSKKNSITYSLGSNNNNFKEKTSNSHIRKLKKKKKGIKKEKKDII